jgi:hypothetical protein
MCVNRNRASASKPIVESRWAIFRRTADFARIAKFADDLLGESQSKEIRAPQTRYLAANFSNRYFFPTRAGKISHKFFSRKNFLREIRIPLVVAGGITRIRKCNFARMAPRGASAEEIARGIFQDRSLRKISCLRLLDKNATLSKMADQSSVAVRLRLEFCGTPSILSTSFRNPAACRSWSIQSDDPRAARFTFRVRAMRTIDSRLAKFIAGCDRLVSAALRANGLGVRLRDRP